MKMQQTSNTQKMVSTKKMQFSATLEALADHCESLDISPLFVADCGSHAWGFASDTSDWDVKFVYVHTDKDKYLSLREPMQHTSFKDVDLNVEYFGADVKKFLNLLLKGNANVYEQVESKYFTPLMGDSARSLRSFTVDVLAENLDKVMAHYYGLSVSTYKERIRNVGEVTMKKWFYVVRPLMCVEHIFLYNRLPPLDFKVLLDTMTDSTYAIPNEVTDVMYQLLAEKRVGDITKTGDKDMVPVDAWVQERHTHWKEYLSDNKNGILLEKVLTNPEEFDIVYRDLLNGTF